MKLTFKAVVRRGRLLLDEPIDLPDGSEIDLMPVHDAGDLDDEDRARLHAALSRAEAEIAAGQSIPADEALRQLGISSRS